MSEKDYTDPKQNPFIPRGSDPDNPNAPLSKEERDEVDMNPERLIPIWPEGGEKKTSDADPPKTNPPDELEKALLATLSDVSGAFEIEIQDGEPLPILSIVKTANGKLQIKTPEGETKDFSSLTVLEKKLIRHQLEQYKIDKGK